MIIIKLNLIGVIELLDQKNFSCLELYNDEMMMKWVILKNSRQEEGIIIIIKLNLIQELSNSRTIFLLRVL